ncbi:uncharacterized protein BN486_02283 [Clostridium clostridioforme CAG:132]|uniref:Uncharacterized protein n=1 Tax=[Clostridium] clostridioforme CAG:132 TaxID=1263065 RepID=R6JLG2_9FIRM|nr:uncharacterized protein BN486_02283 [[Clostridium] clostridioforme CAG:132]
MASAPPASAALAMTVISVTLGLSFMMIGCFACAFTSLVMASTALGSWPKAIPPSFTLGQDILISSISAGWSPKRSTTSIYSSVVFPQTLTTIFVSYCFKKGISLFVNTSTPGFWRPMALSMPPYTSAILGVGLPGHGALATPLVTTAPRRFKSTNSLYSMPEPNVPDASITGFLNSTPAIFTLIFI